jgi:cyclophilin type peptidyl-prolyl cis-trans isomerase/CLD
VNKQYHTHTAKPHTRTLSAAFSVRKTGRQQQIPQMGCLLVNDSVSQTFCQHTPHAALQVKTNDDRRSLPLVTHCKKPVLRFFYPVEVVLFFSFGIYFRGFLGNISGWKECRMSVLIETTVGSIVIDLFVKEAPNASKNFLKLCKIKYYNWCLVHNIQKDFLLQTGDPTGTGRGGQSVYGCVPERRPLLRIIVSDSGC